jgi:hypothetical protein
MLTSSALRKDRKKRQGPLKGGSQKHEVAREVELCERHFCESTGQLHQLVCEIILEWWAEEMSVCRQLAWQKHQAANLKTRNQQSAQSADDH